MVLVPPGEFETDYWPPLMSPYQHGPTKRVRVRVERPVALAAREVTLAEFERFRKDHPYSKPSARTEDCPMDQVHFGDAAAYCNWLSQQEGIPEEQWCYLPNEKGEYEGGMKVKTNALALSGYRLPTAMEWELADRAGSVMPLSIGEATDLLGKYAWHLPEGSPVLHPVGGLRPNDLGLFDLHGNAGEWCHNRDDEFPEMMVRDKDEVVSNSGPLRFTCGGRLGSLGVVPMRSGFRIGTNPTTRAAIGFRVARTIR
jgi:formylglycine-generating enzyme required for sulfatase activity